MNPQILEVQQLLAENRKQFAQSVSQVEVLLEGERAYTRSLVEKSQQKTTPTTAPVESPPKPSKMQKLGNMSDRDLLKLAQNPKKFNELMNGW